MLQSMPGCATVSVWPLSEDFRYLNTWLVWRRGTVSQSLSSFVTLLESRRSIPSAASDEIRSETAMFD
ncbi:hypothetical protein D3C72_2093560 [compost metagenome]